MGLRLRNSMPSSLQKKNRSYNKLNKIHKISSLLLTLTVKNVKLFSYPWRYLQNPSMMQKRGFYRFRKMRFFFFFEILEEKWTLPSNLIILIILDYPMPPFIDNLVPNGPCPCFCTSEWNTHIMITTNKTTRSYSWISLQSRTYIIRTNRDKQFLTCIWVLCSL